MSAVEAVNPWRPLGPCSTDACVSAPAAAAGTARLAARLAMAVLVLAAGVPMSFAGRVRASWRAPLTMTWARMLVRALGVTIRLTGDEEQAHGRAGGALVVANHVSWLDPLVVAATVPSRPLAKREIGEWPVIRTLAAGSGALFIDRERLSALPSAVAAVADALRAGDTVIAFPEGTTWCGRGMGHFRPAVFQAAVDAGAAVRPAVLRYREGTATSTRACYVGDDSLLASLLRVAATRDLAVEMTLLSPVRPGPAGGSRARAALARTELARTAETTVRAGMEDARTHDRHPHPRPA
ncbi:1-acyl-sn-glycerol-3-phosphate acyltransferase [Nonomuraea phyllanthi]|uniref:1-acyl-sn-glycerol-3-phosphate acyltransferase n=1 Tax=Nonomuraea phyllanthi TaxID=2219224 RepID=A0A5C4WNU9_9ACTN|nr:lysophospholipid acyltransferase family protein [Nonomuraea phyllanthi]KAB8195344.1 1-acyl-sn-glycerol-3-phosphate acyltransferase [Nonomuraea phyllanthi]